MNNWFGYAGKILRIDLSNGKVSHEELDADLARGFIGCRGINAKILFDEVGPDDGPFSPGNKLVFGTGPLEGTPVGNGRISVATKSAVKTLAEGGFGGFWGPELKFAGYDHIIVEGISDGLVYLWIDDDRVEIRDASPLKGKTVGETDNWIKEKVGDFNIQVASIGPAGENLVHASTIMGSLTHSAGRLGFGEIMGGKKLKAIAIRGSKGVRIAKPRHFRDAYREYLKCLDWSTADDHQIPMYHLFGPGGGSRIFNFTGNASTRNHQCMSWDSVEENMSGERYFEKYVKKPRACFCCPYASCGEWYEITSGEFAGTKGENTWSNVILCMGHLVGCDSLEAGLKVRNLCNEYGLDTLFATYAIAWAMECRQKGILSRKDMDGIDLKWGNYRAMIEMIEKIGKREGFGDILARGLVEASKIVGKGSENFALTVKKQELDYFDHRNFYQVGLGVATSESGPDHTKWFPPYFPPVPPSTIKSQLDELGIDIDPYKVGQTRIPDEKAKFMKWREDTGAVIESLPSCVFMVKGHLALDYSKWLHLFNAATGFDFSLEELMACGERVVNVERAIIAREGYRRADDTIPERMMKEPAPLHNSGPLTRETLDRMLDEYYVLRGWDPKTAVPTEEKLKDLGLGDVADNLRKNGVF